MTLPETFRCYYVERSADGAISASVTRRPTGELPPGNVVLRAAWTSLNYKDALAATGHMGVNRVFPHIPGVDAAGTVVESQSPEFAPGDRVLVTGYDMGANRWGGFSELVRVPHDWIVPLPAELDLFDSMVLGTAGLTAALSVDALRRHDVAPDRGEVVVTGASGGVGSMAVGILARLGYRVVAVSGKPSAKPLLAQLGAAEVLPREAVDDRSGKPLLSGRWAGAVDTVGGNTLSTLLRTTRHAGCVTACGLVGGNDLPVTVYPFILRGVTLAGIDAAQTPLAYRRQLWQNLAGPWRPSYPTTMVHTVRLDEVAQPIAEILAGAVAGRIVVDLGDRQANAR